MSDTNTESLLKEVKELIEKVNAILPEDKKVSLEQKEKIQTVNLFVCEYKDKFNTGIEIFKKQFISSEIYCSNKWVPYIDQGFLYKSIVSDKKALNLTHLEDWDENKWAEIGYSFKYRPWQIDSSRIVVNCELTNIISYNDVRTSMLSDGVISDFNINYTTNKEITKVLAYLHSNYLKKENRYPRKLEKNK